MPKDLRLILIGLGNLGRRFCDILVDKGPALESKYGLRVFLVAAADSQGLAFDPTGLDIGLVSRLKADSGRIADYPGCGREGRAIELLADVEADLLCEASPVNLSQGAEPGLSHVRLALDRGMHVVTPNKGPLALAYRELHALAAEKGVKLRFDGTVAGGLAALNVGQRDLRGSQIQRIEAIPNLVTGMILDLLGDGLSWEQALSRAREQGVLEADPSFDLDGWDAASKLVILANTVMDADAGLEDVSRTGITGISSQDLQSARDAGLIYRLLATAERQDSESVRLRVAPTPLPADHFLARLGRYGMGVVYHTDIYGTQMAAIEEKTPIPSAATMLRDLLDIYS